MQQLMKSNQEPGNDQSERSSASGLILGFPYWVGIDEPNRTVWISNRDRNNVARIDPVTNRALTEVDVGRGPYSVLAIVPGSLAMSVSMAATRT